MGEIVAIVQARLSSTRLSGKVLKRIVDKTLLEHVLERVAKARSIGKIVVATTVNPRDDELCLFLERIGIPYFRGSEEDVLKRFFEAARAFQCQNVCRITPDDPFKDPQVIDRVARMFLGQNLDFAYNNHPPTFPEGLDTEIFTFEALARADRESKDPFEREHLTQYLYRHPELFRQSNLSHEGSLSHLRWTIDTPEDFDMARRIFEELYPKKKIFLMNDILEFLERNPEIPKINSSILRSHHYR